MTKFFFIAGAILASLGVGLGAFGAHALSSHFSKFPDLEATYETAVRYQMYHALALFALAWASTKWGHNLLNWGGILIIIGIIIFSGSLYLLTMLNIRWLGAITPIGGAAFLAGWLCVIIAVWRS